MIKLMSLLREYEKLVHPRSVSVEMYTDYSGAIRYGEAETYFDSIDDAISKLKGLINALQGS